MTKLLFAKHLGSLRPTDEAGEEMLYKLRAGEVVSVETKRPRNVQHHRMFWALMTIVWQNLPEPSQERYPTVETLVAAVKIAAGHRDLIVLPNGRECYVPRSISFAKMDQVAFSKFYDAICDLIAKHFLPGVTSEELKAEVETMIGARAA